MLSEEQIQTEIDKRFKLVDVLNVPWGAKSRRDRLYILMVAIKAMPEKITRLMMKTNTSWNILTYDILPYAESQKLCIKQSNGIYRPTRKGIELTFYVEKAMELAGQENLFEYMRG